MAIATMQDLVLSYRKAKVDLYYSSDPRLFDLLRYEEDLERNLSDLLGWINSGSTDWVWERQFIGGFTLMPRRLDPPDRANGLRRSDPRKRWNDFIESGEPPVAEFRLMSHCSIHMHVLSSFWMATAGASLDARLTPAAMGNRLRRTKEGAFNRFSSGSFLPYIGPYRAWRDGGLEAMGRAVTAGMPILALTADADSYYHNLRPSFLTDALFGQTALRGNGLTGLEPEIHGLFAEALNAWSRHAGDALGRAGAGLPVGLPASGVVANLALIELDRIVAEEFKPLFYGRYVDDILLVLEDSENLDSPKALWEWMAARSQGLLEVDEPDGSLVANFAPSYLTDSSVCFKNEKNKVFQLSGSTGQFLLASIRRSIQRHASEWRALPDIPVDADAIGSDVASATSDDGQEAITLRDTDKVSLRRSAFAIQLRDFESWERNLDSDSWKKHREAFFEAVCSEVLVLPTFFDLAGYTRRLIGLATSDQNLQLLERVLMSLLELRDQVRNCRMALKGYEHDSSLDETIYRKWTDQLSREISESLASSWVGTAPSSWDRIYPLLSKFASQPSPTSTVQRLRAQHKSLHLRDMARVPYRFSLAPPCLLSSRSEDGFTRDDTARLPPSISDNLPASVRKGLDLLVDKLAPDGRSATDAESNQPTPGSQVPGIVFATRPFNMLDLYVSLSDSPAYESNLGLAKASDVKQMLLAIRGYQPTGDLPKTRKNRRTGGREVWVQADAGANGKRRLALTMIDTKLNSWKAAAIGKPDLSASRFQEMSRVFNEVMQRHPNPNYVLLPELALPTTWFVPFALRLQRKGVNLISGIEYRTASTSAVRNQVWAALGIDGLGFQACFVYTQDKQRPAHQEARDLHDLAGLRLDPVQSWSLPPVLVHGDFRFSLLICSELTNIEYRASLRGNVDAVFVPEWNKDLRTFASLVESSAMDLHAYIVQSNHRQFGDSRIRAPMANDWERDLARIRGGLHDYVVVAEIDFWKLREHQSAHSARKKFKPLPDGFTISDARRRLPTLHGEDG